MSTLLINFNEYKMMNLMLYIIILIIFKVWTQFQEGEFGKSWKHCETKNEQSF